MVLYAKCVSIRDKQIQDKHDIVDQSKIEEKRKDLMMEIERLKKIKYYEDLEKSKKDELKVGHDKIVDQIKKRDLQRLRLQEEKEREGEDIVKSIKQLQKDEALNSIVSLKYYPL